MVLYIDRMSSDQPHDINAQKHAMQACLRALQNIGYNIPMYSFMRIGALDVVIEPPNLYKIKYGCPR